MHEWDPIGVLWSEDLPGASLPSTDLGQYSPYFRIISRCGDNLSVRTIGEYYELLETYRTNGTAPGSLPAEIAALDYDLSKFKPGSDRPGRHSKALDPSGRPPADAASSVAESGARSQYDIDEDVKHPNPDDFDGCIIGGLYASEFHMHPCGIVVTTYQKESERHRCAKRIEEYLHRFYGIETTFVGDRSWRNIVEAGVKALRSRIEVLQKEGTVRIAPGDLIELATTNVGNVLTIASPYATRRLPARGIFMDASDSKWRDAARSWALSLLKTKSHVEGDRNCDQWLTDLGSGMEAATKLWDAWLDEDNDEELTAKRRQLSELELAGCASATLQGLRNDFGVQNGECTQHVVDLRRFPGSSQRWAALCATFMFLQCCQIGYRRLRAKCDLEGWHCGRGFEPDHKEIYGVLFPRPYKPLKLPADPSATWSRMLKNLGVVPSDLLAGGSLTPIERGILHDYCVATLRYPDHEWDEFTKKLLSA